MKKYVLHISGGQYDDFFESYIPFETDDIDRFESDILDSKDKWETYHIFHDGEQLFFGWYKIYTLGEWFEVNSPEKFGTEK